MQPHDNPASIAATTRLLADGICDFDVTMGGARLRPIRVDSRKYCPWLELNLKPLQWLIKLSHLPCVPTYNVGITQDETLMVADGGLLIL